MTLDVTRPSEERICSKERLPGRSHSSDTQPNRHTTWPLRLSLPAKLGSAPHLFHGPPDDHLLLHRRVPVAAFSLTLAWSFRDSVKEFKVGATAFTEPCSSNNFRAEREGRGNACAEETQKGCTLMLRSGLSETTFPASLCATLTKQGKLHLQVV
jgi:hypothetical protein